MAICLIAENLKTKIMTKEEIKKAAKECCEYNHDWLRMYDEYFIQFFNAGFQFADIYWKEKTRWKSLEKEPPKFNGEPFYITLKHKGSGIETQKVVSDKTIGYFIEDGFVEYKLV